MSFEADEEILQDFLVEAGEILELLSEQLVELESRPEDMNLLNAIFRGFHTVKGGAGFLQLNELVECCHIAENVFDILRKGERRVNAELMDVVLEALDSVNSMFHQVRERTEVTPAPAELLQKLAVLAAPEAAAPAAEEQEAEAMDAADAEFEHMLAMSSPDPEEPTADEAADIITEEEFEALLDQLHGDGRTPVAAEEVSAAGQSDSNSDEITDDEFEALLDQLHGEGKFSAAAAPDTSGAAADTPSSTAAGDDEITDDEFEDLLDQLHGKGRFQVEAAEKPAAAPAPAPAPKVAPKPAPAPAPAATPAPSAGA